MAGARWSRRAPRLLGPELPGRRVGAAGLAGRDGGRAGEGPPAGRLTPRRLSAAVAVVGALLLMTPFFTYLAGPEPQEWGVFAALLPMALWSWPVVGVGAVTWAVGLRRDRWLSAFGRGVVTAAPLAFLATMVASLFAHP